MSGLWQQIVLVAVLVLLNAAFAGTELALVSLREGQLQRLEQRSSTGALVARLARDPNRFFATIQIGITLAGFLASAAAAVSLAEPLEEPLDFLGGAARPVSIIVVTLLLAYFTLVFGELAPKRVAMQRAERWALLTARPLSFMATITRPVVWLLSKSTDIAVRLMGGDPDLQREEVTEAELREMVGTQTTFTAKQRLIIDGAFEIAERTLDEVLRPRPDVLGARRRLAGHPCHPTSWRPAGTHGLRWPTIATSTTSSGWCTCATCSTRAIAPWASWRSRSSPSPRPPACSTSCTRCRRGGCSWRWSSTSTAPPPAS